MPLVIAEAADLSLSELVKSTGLHMQGDQNFFPQKPMTPLADQVGGGYMHNAQIAPFFGRTILPLGGSAPSANHLTPFHGVNFQSSNACPKNFVIFDQTDNRSQIMFHPAIAPKICSTGLNVGGHYFQENPKSNHADYGTEVSSSLKEDSYDIDLLLSLEEDEEGDEEEVSTARTQGNYRSGSPDSICSDGLKPRKSRLASSSEKSTGNSSSCSGTKRQKMRKMVKTLRGIVPGCDQMNTVAVLDEAVRYLKSLKVEVRKLGVGNLKS
ncbi:hypothetical protein RJ639_028314 [Escallonia herrerae]|uniref:BHLH domain-containing protein n=1 Tax=Escallonia herrerae TaxID=1293975 RepID=A0AA88X331_9ASTE|nr:hypothetical protein RJ639_028314 [Escallonia herrerae]